jgi:hypothetical protein
VYDRSRIAFLLLGPIPTSFAQLTSMNYLYINNNKFSGLVSDVFHLIPPSVTDLELSENMFSGTVSFDYTGLKLENLYLRQNFFTGSIPDEVPLLADILKLDIGDNMMTGTLPTSLHTVGVVLLLSRNFVLMIQLYFNIDVAWCGMVSFIGCILHCCRSVL